MVRVVAGVVGAVLAIAALVGGAFYSLWIAALLVPLVCVSASWMMSMSARYWRKCHFALSAVVTLYLACSLFYQWLPFESQLEWPRWGELLFTITWSPLWLCLFIGLQAALFLPGAGREDQFNT